MPDLRLMSAEKIRYMLEMETNTNWIPVPRDIRAHITAQSEIIAAALKETEEMEHEADCNYIPERPKGECVSFADFVREINANGPTDICNCSRGRFIAILKGEK